MATSALENPTGGGQYTPIIKGTDAIIYNTKSNASGLHWLSTG